MVFYRLNGNGNILDFSDFKYAEECLETEKEIIRGFDGALRFAEELESEEYKSAEQSFLDKVDKSAQIENKINRLEELRKDFEQDRLGFEISDLEQKKEEYRTLLNEVRVLQGKPERRLK